MLVWLAAALLLASEHQVPKDVPVQDPVTELAPVVVDGRPLDERARAFVAAATDGPPGRALARWERPLCIGVANLQPEVARAVIDRMSEVAVSVGVRTEPPDCKPNLLILAARSGDAEAVVRRAIARSEFDFRPTRGGTDRGRDALEAFASSTAPVRWWHVSLPVIASTGVPAQLLDNEHLMGPAAGAPSAFGEAAPVLSVQVDSVSRTHSAIRNDLMRVIIVIDVDQAAAVPLSALADYLALVGLAQIDPETRLDGAHTILNLFNADAKQHPPGMTEWDAALLISLYEARNNPASPNHQQIDMGRRLARVIEHESAAAH